MRKRTQQTLSEIELGRAIPIYTPIIATLRAHIGHKKRDHIRIGNLAYLHRHKTTIANRRMRIDLITFAYSSTRRRG